MSTTEKTPREDDKRQAKTYSPALTTRELGQRISALGIQKANTQTWQMLLLGVLAGLYIGFGGHVYLVAMSQHLGSVVGGAAFGVGLVLVVIAGAELFTGDVIMLVGAVSRHFSPGQLLRAWTIVYIGNFIGAYLFAWGVWEAGLLGTPGSLNALGETAAAAAAAKLALPFAQAFIRGFFCNILVLLAIIMATLCRDVISKVICCILPIMVFVACGFEHCVANMTIIPLGMLARGGELTTHLSMFRNLVPVTLGNIAGGVFILFIHPNRIRQLAHLMHARPRPASGDS